MRRFATSRLLGGSRQTKPGKGKPSGRPAPTQGRCCWRWHRDHDHRDHRDRGEACRLRGHHDHHAEGAQSARRSPRRPSPLSSGEPWEHCSCPADGLSIPTAARHHNAYLADEVGILLFGLLADDNGILPDGIVSLVSLAGLQLGDNVELLLLLQVLIQSEGVILLLFLAARTAFSLVALGGSGSLSTLSRGSPYVVVSGGAPALSGRGSLGLGIGLGSCLDLELGVGLVAAPALVDLLVRVAGNVTLAKNWTTEWKEHTSCRWHCACRRACDHHVRGLHRDPFRHDPFHGPHPRLSFANNERFTKVESNKGTYNACEARRSPRPLPLHSGSHEGQRTCRHAGNNVRHGKQSHHGASGQYEQGQRRARG